MSITIYYDRSYVFGTVLEYAVGSCTWHRVYEIYPRPPRAADQFPSLSAASRLVARRVRSCFDESYYYNSRSRTISAFKMITLVE